MPSLYDRADIYDLFEDEKHIAAYRKHWETIFQGKDIQSVLDVSIGSGGVSLPMLDMGITLSGSDLSETMLERCRNKALLKSRTVELKCSDFRNLDCWGDTVFDCVASTGNSLPYVNNDDVMKTLEEMNEHVKPGGYLYLDIRNWDGILEQKQRFYLYDPMFRDGNRVNVMQVWDYNSDGSMIFNILYTFEKDNHIFQKEVFEEHYFPISRRKVIAKLEEMGYTEIEVNFFPSYFEFEDVELLEWHSIIAKKG